MDKYLMSNRSLYDCVCSDPTNALVLASYLTFEMSKVQIRNHWYSIATLFSIWTYWHFIGVPVIIDT